MLEKESHLENGHLVLYNRSELKTSDHRFVQFSNDQYLWIGFSYRIVAISQKAFSVKLVEINDVTMLFSILTLLWIWLIVHLHFVKWTRDHLIDCRCVFPIGGIQSYLPLQDLPVIKQVSCIKLIEQKTFLFLMKNWNLDDFLVFFKRIT